MKNLKCNQRTTLLNMKSSNILSLLFAGLFTISCSDGNKNVVVNTTDIENTGAATAEGSKYAKVSSDVVQDYMNVKNALVETNQEKASEASQKLATSLKSYNLDDHSSTLSPSIISASEHAQKMVNSNIEEQREEFELLTADLIKIIKKTGTNTTLYQQFCPMYGEDGAVWLSTEEKISNPYFGDKMLNCGSTQKKLH